MMTMTTTTTMMMMTDDDDDDEDDYDDGKMVDGGCPVRHEHASEFGQQTMPEGEDIHKQ